MTLQDQLRKLMTGGPGVTHIATETLFEECAQKLDDDWKDHQALMKLLADEKHKNEQLREQLATELVYGPDRSDSDPPPGRPMVLGDLYTHGASFAVFGYDGFPHYLCFPSDRGEKS